MPIEHPDWLRSPRTSTHLTSCILSPRLVIPLKKPSRFTPAHDAVVAGLSHKHDLIINVGAGLVQLIYSLPLQMAIGTTHQQITVTHFGENKKLHLESFKQNFYIMSLWAIIKAILTSLEKSLFWLIFWQEFFRTRSYFQVQGVTRFSIVSAVPLARSRFIKPYRDIGLIKQSSTHTCSGVEALPTQTNHFL